MARQDRGFVTKRNADGKTVYVVRISHYGHRRKLGPFSTKKAARDCYEKIKNEQREGRFFPEAYHARGLPSVPTVMADYLTTRSTLKSQRDDRYFSTWWARWFGTCPLRDLTVTRIEDARQHLLRQECTPPRVNRYVAWLRHFCNVQVKQDRMVTNPVLKLTMYRDSQPRVRCLTEAEEAKLLRALGPDAPIARFALLTGLRQREQFHLRWSDVDWDRGRLTLADTKAGKPQEVVLVEEAMEILRTRSSLGRSAFVFPSSRRPYNTPLDPDNFMRRYRAAVKLAGIPHTTFHDLRHTFASRVCMVTRNAVTVQRAMRHSNIRMTEKYIHFVDDFLVQELEKAARIGMVPKLVPEGQPT